MKRFANNFFKDNTVKSAKNSYINSLQTFIEDNQTQSNNIIQNQLQAKNNNGKNLLPLVRTRRHVNLIQAFSEDQEEADESNKSSIGYDLSLSTKNIL